MGGGSRLPSGSQTTVGVEFHRPGHSAFACRIRPVRRTPSPSGAYSAFCFSRQCSFWKDANLAQTHFISHIRSCTTTENFCIHSVGLSSCKLSRNRRLCGPFSTAVRAQQGLSVRSWPLRDCKEKAVMFYGEDTSRGCLSAV